MTTSKAQQQGGAIAKLLLDGLVTLRRRQEALKPAHGAAHAQTDSC